jgi:hypothetical protein
VFGVDWISRTAAAAALAGVIQLKKTPTAAVKKNLASLLCISFFLSLSLPTIGMSVGRTFPSISFVSSPGTLMTTGATISMTDQVTAQSSFFRFLFQVRYPTSSFFHVSPLHLASGIEKETKAKKAIISLSQKAHHCRRRTPIHTQRNRSSIIDSHHSAARPPSPFRNAGRCTVKAEQDGRG